MVMRIVSYSIEPSIEEESKTGFRGWILEECGWTIPARLRRRSFLISKTNLARGRGESGAAGRFGC